MAETARANLGVLRRIAAALPPGSRGRRSTRLQRPVAPAALVPNRGGRYRAPEPNVTPGHGRSSVGPYRANRASYPAGVVKQALLSVQEEPIAD